ncbi:2-oxo acid dehydrogenase subunit E2 [Tessaracoccus rhinocerotis]|uniref:Dihydrolipoamide acetyltransferase component of pyruvate dehydrogenase complex n=1 Tax=Tessaracoccus rhinocerotis TaxID=1689449 RepID=A0A553K0I7_9ACTN|nr:2-oxo acid dehydrogenase subunit E2 [Tessaracoccus rhinocerotis]
MLRKFLLPDPGEGLVEAEIVAWRVAEGDIVEVNDVLVEIETSKSLVELPSPWAGTIKSLLVAEGTTVEVGAAIIELDDGVAESVETEAPAPNLVGTGPSEAPRSRRRGRRREEPSEVSQAISDSYEPHEPGRRPDEVHPAGEVHAQPVGDPLPTAGKAPTESTLVLASDPTAVRAKPPIRKYAKDLGVDLGTVVGSGPDGTITRADVEAAVAFQRLADEPRQGRIVNDHSTFQRESRQDTFPPGGGYGPFGAGSGFGAGGGAQSDPFNGRQERRVPIRGVRKATAENLVRSVNTHVHVTEWITIDVTPTMDFVEKLKNRREFTGLRISPLLVYAKAICLALARNPDLNTSWDEENQEIVYHPGVNLGVAAATPRGLMVPNIKNADQLSLIELCRAINQLVAVSREGKLQPGDYTGGTFTITNVGVFGVDAGTPIINGNESAIFCMGAIQRRPWVVETNGVEEVVPRSVTTLAIAFDHRIIDGEQGSQFLHDVAEILAEPALALLF